MEIKDTLSLDNLGLLLAFVWPGWLAVRTYGLLMPTRDVEWKDTVAQGLFFSVITYVLFFPAVLVVLASENIGKNPWLYWACLALLLFVGPVVLAFLYRQLFRWTWLAKRLQAPYPTAWDYFFDRREPCFILVHLKTGAMIGGYWSAGSYASSFPREGELYISVAVLVNEKGEFQSVVDRTKGILIRKDEYSYLEFFSAAASSEQSGGSDAGQRSPQAAGT